MVCTEWAKGSQPRGRIDIVNFSVDIQLDEGGRALLKDDSFVQIRKSDFPAPRKQNIEQCLIQDDSVDCPTWHQRHQKYLQLSGGIRPFHKSFWSFDSKRPRILGAMNKRA